MKATGLLIGLNILLGAGLTSSAVSIGQVDTFEDGTTQNWIVGLLGAPHPAPPVNEASGGPSGTDDNFLHLSSLGGLGAGGRLTALNISQWAGDYIAAGVAIISMDVNNLGTTDLALRLAFSDPLVGPPVNIAFSANAVLVPAGGGWTSVAFPVQVVDLLAGLGSVEDALKNTTELRIYHSIPANFPNPITPVEPIVAQLGIDNIRAQGRTVPDAGSTALMLTLPMMMLLANRRISKP
jgi:hypothetical protein